MNETPPVTGVVVNGVEYVPKLELEHAQKLARRLYDELNSPFNHCLTAEAWRGKREALENYKKGIMIETYNAQVAGEQKILARVIELVRRFPLGHTAHWDAQGNHGRTCPLCRAQSAAKQELLRVLQEPAATDAPTPPALCECAQWCRAMDLAYATDHHPDCPHYNDSLIDVWKVTVDGVSCYTDNEQDAGDTAGKDIIVVALKMHREVFKHLPEFEGF